MTENGQTGPIVLGKVKWFDSGKGFGFVVSDDGGPDILLHSNVLQNFGQSSVADGAVIEVSTHRTDRGMQAVSVLRIEPAADFLNTFGYVDDGIIDEGSDDDLEPARVKWFDKGKGFGFANIFGDPADVFIHIDILHHAGLADLQAGEAVCLRVVDGRRGRLAVRMTSWDFAIRSAQAEA